MTNQFKDDMKTFRTEDARLGALIDALIRFEDLFKLSEATTLRKKLRDDRYLLHRVITEGAGKEFLDNTTKGIQ